MTPSMTILYVDNPEKICEFYKSLLKKEPFETFPTFALFVLDSGFQLGLLSKHTVEPQADFKGACCEIDFQVESQDKVREIHQLWKQQGLPILQEPVALDFGYTFVASDPDGHRLRVYFLYE